MQPQKHTLSAVSGVVAAFVPHLLVTCCIMAITFYCIHQVNDAMCFLTARISTGFQSAFWLLTLCATAVCTAKPKPILRWLAIPPMLLTAVLTVPALRAYLLDDPTVPAMAFYQHALLIDSLLILSLAVTAIVIQRKKAMAAYRAAVTQGNPETENIKKSSQSEKVLDKQS